MAKSGITIKVAAAFDAGAVKRRIWDAFHAQDSAALERALGSVIDLPAQLRAKLAQTQEAQEGEI